MLVEKKLVDDFLYKYQILVVNLVDKFGTNPGRTSIGKNILTAYFYSGDRYVKF